MWAVLVRSIIVDLGQSCDVQKRLGRDEATAERDEDAERSKLHATRRQRRGLASRGVGWLFSVFEGYYCHNDRSSWEVNDIRPDSRLLRYFPYACVCLEVVTPKGTKAKGEMTDNGPGAASALSMII